MKKLSFIFFLTSFIFFFSCKNTNSSDSTQTESTTNPPETVIEEKKEEPITKLYAWVDKLNLRSEPTTTSEIVAEVKEGTQLIFLNEKTDYTERINLRGQLFNEPWLKVKTEDGKEAWVYGGAVKFYKPVVDINPSPYDKCFRLKKDGRTGQAQVCYKETRLKQLRVDSKFVNEDKGVTLKLLGGNQTEIKDMLDPDSSMINHLYIDYLPKVGFFVLKNYYFEALDYSLVNDKSGKITTINGFPKASPDGKYLVTSLGPDFEVGVGYRGTEIYGFPNGRFAKVFEEEWPDYGTLAPKWVDNNTIEITLMPIGENGLKPKIINLKLDDSQNWTISDE